MRLRRRRQDESGGNLESHLETPRISSESEGNGLSELPADGSTPAAETARTAPVIGEVQGGLDVRLDAHNAFRLPSMAADGGLLTSQVWVAAASLTGLGHSYHGTTGQDSYAFAAGRESGMVAIAVSDGLGSKTHTAQIGAVLVSRIVCDLLTGARIPSDASELPAFASECLHKANRQLREYRSHYMVKFADEDLSSTLAFCLLPETGSVLSGEALIGRVGDCAAFTLSEDEWANVFPRETGPLNVLTRCLPTNDVDNALETARIHMAGLRAIVLTTDGLAEDIYNSPALRGWLRDCWSEPCDGFKMVEALRYRRRGSHDDRTAAVVWPSHPEVGISGDELEKNRGVDPPTR